MHAEGWGGGTILLTIRRRDEAEKNGQDTVTARNSEEDEARTENGQDAEHKAKATKTPN